MYFFLTHQNLLLFHFETKKEVFFVEIFISNENIQANKFKSFN